MARNVSNGAEQGEDQDDRRMNAYMSGIQSTSTDVEEDEGDEVEASHFRRQRRRARRAEY